ncbi:MAG: Flp pilus assembly complex ATPase component TadA [Candidatus Nanopelagicales bacterium]|nr:Flp pilus assembly complex ATPase component TadA [Candidatus Nanopelagicales bacterium]
MSGAVSDVVQEVRARVWTGGISPQDESTELRHIVEDILAREKNSTEFRFDAEPLLPVAEHIALHISGFGLLQPLLEDPEVEEIWINEPDRIFVARNGRSELTNVILDEIEVRGLVERMLAASGRRVDLSNPFVDATLPDGSRLHVAIPDITRKHWSVNIRKFIMGTKSLDGLVQAGTLTEQAAAFLQACVLAGLNIIVAGATQAGKTTLMNALLNSAPSSERVITCEEVFELQLTSPDWVALQTRQASLEGTGEITLRRLIKEALRMRPSRLVIGEVRQEEALDLLVAMNAGMPSMCSIHANGAREAISKLCLLPMLAGSNVSAEFVIPTVASVVDIVVHTALQLDGTRKVQQITSVTGRVEGSNIETGEIFSTQNSQLVPQGIFPGKLENFSARGIDLAKLVGARAWD